MHIDLTPTWESLLPLLLAVIVDGTPEGRDHVIAELTRMAQAADQFNQLVKENNQ